MSQLTPAVAWTRSGRGGGPLDARAVPLLRAVAEHGTLTAAAAHVGLSYRAAWGVVEELAHHAGAALVVLERGRGARLTPAGERLVASDTAAAALLAAHARELAIELGAAQPPTSAGRRLRIAASHDLALGALRDAWRARHGIDVEFHGSAASLASYVEGAADLAGFHVAQRRPGGRDVLLSLLRPGRDAVICFLHRTQGLILPRGNPKRVRTLVDVAAKHLRFVNRQPGSGTRILFDRLLAANGLARDGIEGYSNEEFTHAAVAATVAAGKADAGFGLEGAAAQFGLAFVPVAQERYLFACQRRAAESRAVVQFRRLLASRETQAVVARLPGYAADAPGTLAELARKPGGAIVLS